MTEKEMIRRRREFEAATWRDANRAKLYGPILYNAGPLGYCILRWVDCKWENEWFRAAKKLKP